MKDIPVDVQADFIERLSSVAGRPITGILELVWNALDADATFVEVTFEDNDLNGLAKVTVADNGTGIDPAHVEAYFGGLGGSWKRTTRHSPQKRVLHGSQGKGRFKAFGIGSRVEWQTVFGPDRLDYTVVGKLDNIKRFQMTPPKKSSLPTPTGTVVTIERIDGGFPSIRGDEAVQTIAEAVAVYLEQYPSITFRYDGRVVDPRSVQLHRAEYPLGPVVTDYGDVDANLVVIEWTTAATRKLYLCDDEGCALNEMAPGIHAPGHSFTAYVRSAYVRHLEGDNLLGIAELHPGLQRIVDAAKLTLREHFARRDAEKAAETLQRWREEDVYPYDGGPESPVDAAERQVFDVVALNIDERLPGFGDRDVRSRKLTFRLVQQALRESPEALGKILTEVLELPADKRAEFAALLERTSLSAIINASKVVTDRLDFIAGLNKLVFEPEVAKVLKERTQLHRILASETWIFGEEHHLMVDDRGLTEVLRQVLEKEAPEVKLDTPVTTETGHAGIVDLMFGRAKKHWGGSGREYLVVELKRPTVKIDNAALQQCWKYAEALVNHPKFRSTPTRWDFWALSRELDDFAKKQASQPGRPRGVVMEDPDGRYRIWAMEWGPLLREVESRHQFFKDQLNIEVEGEDASAYLRTMYEAYLPATGLPAR